MNATVAGCILLCFLSTVTLASFVGYIIYMFGKDGAVMGPEDRVKRLREEGRI